MRVWCACPGAFSKSCFQRLRRLNAASKRTTFTGRGSRLDQIFAWLDANCGADGWTSAPSSTRGVVNDALAIYFADVTLANAFVTRWCSAQRIEIMDGMYRVRDDEPTTRIGAGLHKTP
jgi:hypothetical protein